MKIHNSLLLAGACAALCALLPATAGAQVATSLINEGDPLPSAGAGHTVMFINNTAVNGVGGYAATVNSSDGVTTLSHAWGSATGGPGAILRTEGVVGIYDQQSFESFFGMDDLGQLSYGATCTDTGSGASGLDSVFVDGTPLSVEDQPIPSLPGKLFRFASRPGITNDGTPYWLSGIDDAGTGANEGSGLFTPAGVLLKSGDLIAGLPAPLSTATSDFDVRFSAQGGHYIIGADTTAPTSDDFFMLLDGLPIASGAGLMGQGQPVPASAGGLPGETWAIFDFYGVNENGDYMVTGNTSAATSSNEFISFNGTLVYREGDTVDGETLTGSIEGASMNEAGDMAYIWDVVDPIGGGSLEALFLDNDILLKEGDAVDFFGQDGVVEPNSTLANFTGITALTVGSNRRLYFTADIDVNGTTTSVDDIEGFFCIHAPWDDLGNGLAGTGGITPLLVGDGALTTGSSASVTLSGALPNSQAWLLFGLSQVDVPFRGGILVPSPDIVLAALPISGTGDLALATTWPALPSNTAVTFQYWVIDPAGPVGVSASNGLSGTTP